MAMYYYASKLNEASCSGCQLKTQPAPPQAPSMPPGALDSSVTTGTTLIHGSALSYYDNDDYYSMVRTPKISTDKLCKHSTMNGGMIPVQLASSGKPDERQMSHILPISVKSASPSPIPMQSLDTVDAILPEVEYRDGQLVCATLDALVDMLRLNTSKSYAFTFILCSRLYIKPHELLAKLSKRHFKNCEKQKLSAETELAEMAALVRVLGEWTRNFPYDFRDDRMMALVRSITQRCATEHMAAIRDEVSVMLQKLLERLTALEQYEETLCESPQVASVELLLLGDVLTLGLSPVELATQLTIVELHRLSFIGPEEFVQAFTPVQTVGAAGGSSYNNAGVGLLHSQGKSTRNLEAYADWFNRLSYLVATDILKAVKTKYRVRVLEQWVMCARECFNLGNFNSLMSIISALNMAPISRLKKTWSRASGVAEQQLRALEVCVAPGGNHARYRAARAAAGPSAVPLLSVTCRDLHFAHHAAPNRLSGNRINFEKCRDLARHVSNQLASRRLLIEDGASGESASSSHSALENQKPHEASWRYLNDKPTLTEHGMELASFEREPPSDHMEKERYKRLRLVP